MSKQISPMMMYRVSLVTDRYYYRGTSISLVEQGDVMRIFRSNSATYSAPFRPPFRGANGDDHAFGRFCFLGPTEKRCRPILLWTQATTSDHCPIPAKQERPALGITIQRRLGGKRGQANYGCFLWQLKIRLGKKAPAITLSQLRILIEVVLPLRTL